MIKRPRNVMMLLTLELLILLVINVNTISGIVNSSCTFESGQCGWSVNGGKIQVENVNVEEQHHSSTGPDKDHTTSSDSLFESEYKNNYMLNVYLRQSLKSRPRETIRNNPGVYDYIESHDLAFPLTGNISSHIQNDGISSNTAYAVHRNTTLTENSTINDHNYSIVDQTPETTLNETRDDGKGTTDSYMVLDPSATGFNRTTLLNTCSDPEFAKSAIAIGNSSGDADQYALSMRGVYDHLGINRHKELEVNIYNHTVDNIYDSGSHRRKEEGRKIHMIISQDKN
ncbi:unnamed protein product [Mytilus edulis]|uniref:Uncharacterized protein n=1 Tax=Mytilus edulis TaxID=6550 RepID=A0A8S3UAV0_MYTED|nr:unnamed protein product [Mytilus edulis]